MSERPVGGLFEGVEDTPFLRAQLRELEQDADVLRDRAARLTRDCRVYRDSLEDATPPRSTSRSPCVHCTAA